MKHILSAVLCLIFLAACSTKAPRSPGKASPPKTPKIVEASGGISFDAKQLANELESNYVTEIRFKKGSTELTPEAKHALYSLVRQARKAHSLESAKLITWADQEMPKKSKENLSSQQVDLVKRRNDVLTRFIQNQERKVDIDPISMAERPKGFSKYIPNETARIQDSLDRAGIPEKGENKHGLGKASRSIIIFTRE